MGWNSYDCFGASVTEAQVKSAADYMAANLSSVGYQYVVVDIRWYDPNANTYALNANAAVTMDQYGRLLPAVNKFPSSSGGLGFKPLADYVHSKGLKFGIHLMRGIPRKAYTQNTQVFGTSYHARDVADVGSTCRWDDDMYGVDPTRPGGQEYYNSVANLWASWGVDFVKIDDLTADPVLTPTPYHVSEIEAIRKAIDQSGRVIVFSTSPGATPLGQGTHVLRQANMWRIDDDLWDNWSQILLQFQKLSDWTPYRRDGHFPDADMLPLGKIGGSNGDNSQQRFTNFTPDEQRTLMTLWCIARSSLMYGGDLSQMDSASLALITNPEVLGINQSSSGNRQLSVSNGLYVWVANVPNSTDKYVGFFNTRDPVAGQTGAVVTVSLSSAGMSGTCQVRDLWARASVGNATTSFSAIVHWHGANLYRLTGGHNAKPPGTLAATAGNTQIQLVWDSSSGATSYNVYRGTATGGPYSSVATGVSGTTYIDSGLDNGIPYYYVVSANTDAGTSVQSTEVSAVPVGDVESQWQTLDIGYPFMAGAGGASNQIQILRGGGQDVWGTADDFRFYWQQLSGDGTLMARVTSMDHTDDFAKVGVMFREDGTLGARFAFVFVTPVAPNGLAVFQYRDTPNNNATHATSASNTSAERWVKLVRKGSTFYGYHSSDGVNWSFLTQLAVPMASSAYAGLAVNAHNDAAICTASFDFLCALPQSATVGALHTVKWFRSLQDGFFVTNSQVGQSYQLQKRAGLNQSWQNVGAAQAGTGDFLTFADLDGANGSQAFYRVIQGSGTIAPQRIDSTNVNRSDAGGATLSGRPRR
jgi:hypothetical protein